MVIDGVFRQYAFVFYYLAVLAATLALPAFFHFHVKDAGDRGQSEAPAEQDLLSNGELNVYGAADKLLYRARIRQARYSPDEEHFSFTQLRMTYHTGTGKLLVNSGQGRVYDQGATIVFDDEVNLKRSSSDDKVMQEMTTRNLTLDVEQRAAHGKEAAAIRHGKHRIVGTGVRIDLNTGRIKLLEDVRTRS